VTALINLRGEGRARVLGALYRTGRATRPQLQALTGLSRATVSSLIADLISEGLVAEDETVRDGNRSQGRPAQTLSVVPHAAYAAAADIGHAHVHVVVCDLGGTVVWDRRMQNDTDLRPQHTMQVVADAVAEGLREQAVSPQRVLGLGVGIACPVDRTGDELEAAGIMPGWVGVKPATELAALTGLPTRLANDANAGAIGEWLYGAGQRIDDLVYIRLSAGIGAGIISGGRLLRGDGGMAGEIGHVTAARDGLFCRCGNRGCLETVASPPALADLLTRSWGRAVDPAELPGLFAEGHRAVHTAVHEVGEAVGRVLAAAVTLLDPQLVIIGGDLGWAGQFLVDSVSTAIDRYAMPTRRRKIRVVIGELGAAAEVLGAAGLILNAAPAKLAAGQAGAGGAD
jgi:predicted NBD/HSP70 family sugar kinase